VAIVCSADVDVVPSWKDDDDEEGSTHEPRGYLFVDSRYYIQATAELSARWWKMIKVVRPGDGVGGDVASWQDWVVKVGLSGGWR
jgi:hypothetical protein